MKPDFLLALNTVESLRKCCYEPFMKKSAITSQSASTRSFFQAFITEQFPLLMNNFEQLWPAQLADPAEGQEISYGETIAGNVRKLFVGSPVDMEVTPWVSAQSRLDHHNAVLDRAIAGFFRREAIKKSFTVGEKKLMLNGMYLTRAVDNSLKKLFISGEIKYLNHSFQGKGFRSLGQEAIYCSALRLRRGPKYALSGSWQGDLVAPLIRDLGVVLAFTEDDVELAINAQVGKSGKPLYGKDLHSGDHDRGVIIAAAPLAIASATAVGAALAYKLKAEPRIAVSFIGDGGSSLGEWHEAINFAAVQKLPMIFCIQNNQTALSTPVHQQSAARNFGDKALGYGLPHLTIDGTDAEEIAAAFTWAAEIARSGQGPVLLELVSMRMCGHAHHDDMLYLGHDPAPSFELPKPSTGGYVDVEKYQLWAARDPLKCYADKLINEKLCTAMDVENMKTAALERCQLAIEAIKKRSWPNLKDGTDVFSQPLTLPSHRYQKSGLSIETAPPFSPQGITYLEGIWRGLAEAMRRYPEAYVLGEDVGAPYGNAFMLLKPLLKDFQSRLLNTPIAENAIIGACVGMAIQGLRPIGEMQFNDFVASGFNQLVNNAAKLFYRTGQKVPMVMRMPWGGLRRAGPFHSQDTSPWFYRSFGLKIVAPSTPHDAIGLMLSAVADDNPVLFYEHIALYRSLEIKQQLAATFSPIEIGKAAFRRLGTDLSLISYGAYVHRALACAEILAQKEGIECDVLDLRSLCPLDLEAIFATVKRSGKVLLVGEDSCTGSILESIAAKIGSTMFADLDGPVKVLGSLDTPVPYAPSLEDGFLLSNETIIREAKDLHAW